MGIRSKYKKQKCLARPQWMKICDGCKRTGTKCPYRDKYRDLRHTKQGDALYHRKDDE